MTTQLSNQIRLASANKTIDYSDDVFKMILMDTGFVFDPVNHDFYSDVSASELAGLYGYATGGATMAGVSVDRNDITNRAEVTWNNVTWTAAGGDIGPGPGAIIYDDDVSDTIVGYIDFGGDQTQADGGVATISNPKVVL